jgi:hypothetical protein
VSPPPQVPAGEVENSLLHAAVDPPASAVAHWERLDPAVLLEGRLPAGAVHLLPLVWSNLDAAGWEGPTMPRLKGLARRTWLLNRSALPEVESAIAALGAASVETTLLGGAAAALAPWGWSGDLKLRSLTDAAVMVPPADRDRAVETLRGAGWQAGGRMERHARLWQEYLLTSPGGRAIRLAWSPASWSSGIRWWQEGVPVAAGSAASRVLDATDAFLVTCVDGMLSPHRHPLWVADAHRIVAGAAVDPDRCATAAAGDGVEDAFAGALGVLGAEFGLALPFPVPSAATRARSSDRSRRIPPTPLRADWAAVRRNRPAGRLLGDAADFLADRWDLESAAGIPAEAGRRAVRRLRRRSGR